jgi:hypothetical protein
VANTFRGEVEVDVAGKPYTVALTLEALALLAERLGVDTLGEVEQRLFALKIADMIPIMSALLEANGHKVPREDLARMGHKAYTRGVIAIYNARPVPDEAAAGEAQEAGASPRKRAS